MLTGTTRRAILAIVPKVTGTTSFCCSFWMITEVLLDKNDGGRKRNRMFYRLLLGLIFYDLCHSICNFASTWPIPIGTPDVFQPLGTQATCNAQGFFSQLGGLGPPMYNAYLSLYYLLIVCSKKKKKTLQKWVEILMHASAFVVSVGTAVAGLQLNLYNNAVLWCWIASYDCTDNECVRGKYAGTYRWAFFYVPVWLCIAFAFGCMLFFYRFVQHQEATISRYLHAETLFVEDRNANDLTHDPSYEPSHETLLSRMKKRLEMFSSRNSSSCFDLSALQSSTTIGLEASQKISSKNSATTLQRHLQRVTRQDLQMFRDIYVQGWWYLAAFMVNHLFGTVNRLLEWKLGETVFVAALLHSFFTPFQGTMNFMVYRRPQYIAYRRRGKTRLVSMWLALIWSRNSRASVQNQILRSENSIGTIFGTIISLLHKCTYRRGLQHSDIRGSLNNIDLVKERLHININESVTAGSNSHCNKILAIYKASDDVVSNASTERKQKDQEFVEEGVDETMSTVDDRDSLTK